MSFFDVTQKMYMHATRGTVQRMHTRRGILTVSPKKKALPIVTPTVPHAHQVVYAMDKGIVRSTIVNNDRPVK